MSQAQLAVQELEDDTKDTTPTVVLHFKVLSSPHKMPHMTHNDVTPTLRHTVTSLSDMPCGCAVGPMLLPVGLSTDFTADLSQSHTISTPPLPKSLTLGITS